MSPSSQHPLDARARQLLRTLIARYIAEGQPVGSRTLAKASGLDVSPATIRNIMSDLEEFGLVAAPHTSAGRVPTSQGYRVFVDSLLEMQPLGEPEVEQLRRELPTDASTPDLLGSATSLLSEMTRFVGVVSVPKREEFPFRHIDFLSLDGNRVLVILVFTDGQVQNRVIATQRAYGASELEQIANYLNAHFAGMRIDEIRARLLREMREEGARLNTLLSAAVEVAQAGVPEQRRQRHAGRGPDQPDGQAGQVRRRSPARAVRGVPAQARPAAVARTLLARRGRAPVHRRGIGLCGARHLQPGHGAVRGGRARARRARRDRTDAHGL